MPTHPHRHAESMCFLKDKHFIAAGLLPCRFSITVSLTESVWWVEVDAYALSHLYSPVWGTFLNISSVCPFQYSWLAACEETLTLFPRYHISSSLGFTEFWCMAEMLNEAFGLRCNLRDSLCTSVVILINICYFSFSFPFLLAPYLRVNTNDRL